MTRAKVEKLSEEIDGYIDDDSDIKEKFDTFAAHTLALHDDRDSWRRVAERLEREKVALHDKLDRAVELIGKINCNHYYSEDSWYSCPKAEDGCADASQGDECNCGADTVKAGITKILAEIQEEVIDG